jgi:anti-anti-sigma factor
MPITSWLVREQDAVVVVSFHETKIADLAAVQQLEKELQAVALQAASGQKLLVDFSGVEFISSMTIGLIVRLRGECKRAGIQLKLCSLSPNLSEAFRITGLRKVLEIYPDEIGAIDAFALPALGSDI